MAMRVLGLPRGGGSVRDPYRMPADQEVQRFAEGLFKLNIHEIKELRAAAEHA